MAKASCLHCFSMFERGLGQGTTNYCRVECALWHRVAVVEDDDSCWLWTGRMNKKPVGYGSFTFRNRIYYAHRVALSTIETLPENMYACHVCDVANCARPKHLFVGSHSDNMQDCVAKGRFNSSLAGMKGERSPTHKLTNQNVSEIKFRLARGESRRLISERFGVHYNTICGIDRGEWWEYIEPMIVEGESMNPLVPSARNVIRETEA